MAGAEALVALISRREFIECAALSALGLAVPVSAATGSTPVAPPPPRRGFLDLLRAPDRIAVQTATGEETLSQDNGERWTGDHGLLITTAVHTGGALHVALSAPAVAVKRMHLRWRGRMADARLILGDAWERGYGDLEWRAWVPDRVMPWYFATHDGAVTHTYGVRTGARAFCYWHVDPQGISLWADVRSGSAGVQLGGRTLDVCDVLCRAGRANESAFAAVHAFCRRMCPSPRLPPQPIYGSNDWYWAYGKNSADTARADARTIVELSAPGANRPFVVVDDGWQPGRGSDKAGAGAWDRGNDKFPDMPGLAADIRRAGAQPGLWIRPLQAPADAPESWRLPRDRGVLDPSVPEVRQKVADDIARLRRWGFALIKHDYTTFDIIGRWGFQMGSALTREGWTFASGADRTTAEVIDALYGTIRAPAGDSLVIACTTVSLLSAGHFQFCRVGDDMSGTEWARTRKMGVNTLAFLARAARCLLRGGCGLRRRHHRRAVGAQPAVARSPRAKRHHVVRLAGAGRAGRSSAATCARLLARGGAPAARRAARPARTVYPEHWRLMGRDRSFEWVGADGSNDQ